MKKLEDAAAEFKKDAEESGHTVPEIQMWLVSTGGFTKEVLKYVSTRADDYNGINSIFRAYGGNYNILMFGIAGKKGKSDSVDISG